VENSGFLLICIYSLSIVFLILAVLSILIRLLIIVFPEKSSDQDAAILAAVTTHLNRVYPHTQITKMEEQK
jgi:hypothetical protein